MPTSNQRLSRLSLWALRCAGALTLLLGGIGLVGWHVHDRVLIQVHPLFAPMPYIMALGLVCLGVGYVLLDPWPMVGTWAAAGGIAMGLAGCFEVAGLRLGFLTPQWPGALVAPA